MANRKCLVFTKNIQRDILTVGDIVMKFLCASKTSTFLPILILVLGAAVAVLIYVIIQNKMKKGCNASHFRNSNTMEVEVKQPYTTERTMKFLEYLHRAMPKELIAFPVVGVDRIVKPKKDKIAYNSILNKYVDVCIFTRRKMEPVMVVDLVAGNTSVEQYNEMDPDVVAVLKAVKIPVMRTKLDDAYDLESLRENILKTLPSKVVSWLKENYIAENK